jgi:hypothetical protein
MLLMWRGLGRRAVQAEEIDRESPAYRAILARLLGGQVELLMEATEAARPLCATAPESLPPRMAARALLHVAAAVAAAELGGRATAEQLGRMAQDMRGGGHAR